MKCRHCGYELEQDAKTCPNCNLPTGKPRVWQIVVCCVLGVVILLALTLVIMKDQGVDLSGINPKNWFGSKAQTQSTAPAATEPTTEPEDPMFAFDLNRESYTAAEEDPAGQGAKVAAKLGQVELTNAQLQTYYWYSVYNFVTQYQSYFSQYGMDLTAMGLDVTKPLDQQDYIEGDLTWQQFFLEAALTDWHKYASLEQQGKQEGYEMSQEMTQQLQDMLAQVEENWKSEGYDSLDAMIKAELGPLCDEESYLNYLQTYHYSMDYFNTHYTTMEPTEAEIEEYFTAHETELDFTKDTKEYAVRHILIEPQGGTQNADGVTKTYTDEEWEACRAEAQAILDQWKSTDGTEEGFGKLAAEKSVDGGSSANGGLYAGLNESTSFVTEFKDWYLDPNRQVGDTGLVKSVYGYHIMYFSAADTVWQANCYSLLWQEKSDVFVKNCMEKWPVTLFDDQIAIGAVEFPS